jgi:hypothetical protein
VDILTEHFISDIQHRIFMAYNSWGRRGISADWNSIACSSNGQYMIAGKDTSGIYVSSNYGETWGSRGSYKGVSVAISGTGQYQLAILDSGWLYVSSNYGSSFTFITGYAAMTCCGMSSSGQYMTAAFNAGVYTCDDYTYPKYPTYIEDAGPFYCLAVSGSGAYQVAIDPNHDAWVSSDYGITWNNTGYIGVGVSLPGVAVSSTGQYMATAFFGGKIYESSDYGASWTAKDSNRNWFGIAMDATGQYQIAVTGGNILYRSSDYGVNWTASTISVLNGDGICMSSDNTTLAAIGNPGYITVGNYISIQIDVSSAWKEVESIEIVQSASWQPMEDIHMALSNTWKHSA